MSNWKRAFREFKDGTVAVALEELASCLREEKGMSAEQAALLVRAIKSKTLQESKPPRRQKPSDEILLLTYNVYYVAKAEIDNSPRLAGDLRSRRDRALDLARSRLLEQGHELSVSQIRNYVRDARNNGLVE